MMFKQNKPNKYVKDLDSLINKLSMIRRDITNPNSFIKEIDRELLNVQNKIITEKQKQYK